MSEYIPFIFTPNSITLVIDGESIIVNKDNGAYDNIVNAIKAQDWQEVRNQTSIAKSIETQSHGSFKIDNDKVYIEGTEAPAHISRRIMEFYREGLPFEPIVEFWKRLKQNPSQRARERLFLFLEHNGHPLTEDGCFIAYKSVSRDFKDHHTGTFDNSIGAVVTMDRADVNDDPEQTCSNGLHVASREYASDFCSHNSILIYVKVDPQDVVSVPVDYNGQKMRCCRYEVIAQDTGLLTQPVYQPNHNTETSEVSSSSDDYYTGYDEGWENGENDGYEDSYDCEGALQRAVNGGFIEDPSGYEKGFREGYNVGFDLGLEQHEEENEENEDDPEFRHPFFGY